MTGIKILVHIRLNSIGLIPFFSAKKNKNKQTINCACFGSKSCILFVWENTLHLKEGDNYYHLYEGRPQTKHQLSVKQLGRIFFNISIFRHFSYLDVNFYTP